MFFTKIWNKSMKTLYTILILFFFNNLIISQNSMTISYNEKINLGEVAKEFQFHVTGEFGNTILTGTEINDYKFANPGKYIIKLVTEKHLEDNKCDHDVLPDSIIVNVSRVKMIFDGSKMTFSSPIRKNIDTQGIILSIPVSVNTFNHKSTSIVPKVVNSAGVGTSISGVLLNDVSELKEGTYTFRYRLSGVVTENSYLMFDFMDSNKNIQSFSLKTPVKN